MSRLTEWSLKQVSITLLILAALVIGGLYSAFNIRQELLPDLDFPIVTVITTHEGAGPNQVAREVTEPLEASLANINGLESLQSVSAENVSILIAQFDFGDDMKEAEQEIARATNGVSLPGSAGSPQVTRINVNQTIPVIQLSLGGDMAVEELEAIAQQRLVPEIQSIDDVQAVDVIGGTTRNVDVVLNPDEMAGAGVSSAQVRDALQANNLSVSTGAISSGGNARSLRVVSELTSVDEVERLAVGATEEGDPIFLGDIATVDVESQAGGTISRTNGLTSVGIAVTRTQEGNTVNVANAVKDIAAEVEEANGGDVEIETVLDQSVLIEDSISGLTRDAIIGALAVVAAIGLFLVSIRKAVVAGVAIPLSILIAILALFQQGFTLNILVVGGIAIAVGRLVDDSIVVLENVSRRYQEGEELDDAVLNGARQVSMPVLGATLTTIGVFLPLAFTGGFVGVLFEPFALTVTFTLLASILVAFTVVPLLIKLILPRHHSGENASSDRPTLLQRSYLPILRWSLGHRFISLGVAALLFVASLGLLPFIPVTFIEQAGEKEFIVDVSPPPGTGGAERVMEASLEAEEIISGLPDVDVYQTSVNIGAGGDDIQSLGRAIMGQGTQGATIVVRLDQSADLDAVQEEARRQLDTIEDAIISVSSAMGDDVGSQLQLNVLGEAPESVREASEDVYAAVQEVDGVEDLSSSALGIQAETVVEVDPALARSAGLTAAQVAQEVSELTVGQPATQVNMGNGERLDVIVRADPEYIGDIDGLRALAVGPRPVPLSDIALVEERDAPTQVMRLDQRPSASVTGTITASNTGRVNQDVQDRVDALDLPGGVEVEYGGALQQLDEGFEALLIAMAIAVLIVYVVMVLVTSSLVTPLIIMSVLPLAAIGAIVALFITGRPLGISGMFGMLMLIGLVVTNAIVLVHFVNQLRASGYTVRDALVEGGRLRLRPVLMTAITTILALIPMAAGFTEGAVIAAELGTVVIGGLFTATLLTLIVLPVVYSLVDDGLGRARSFFGRLSPATRG